MQYNMPGLAMRFGGMTTARFVQHRAGCAYAFAALQADTEFKLEIIQRVVAFSHGALDMTITDSVADADNHVLDKI